MVLGKLGKHDQHLPTVVPFVGAIGLRHVSPRIVAPVAEKDHHTIAARDVLGAADDVADLTREHFEIATGLRPAGREGTIVLRMGEQLPFRILRFLEKEAIAGGVNVEAVFADQRELGLKSVVVNRGRARDVHVQLRRLGAGDALHTE